MFDFELNCGFTNPAAIFCQLSKAELLIIVQPAQKKSHIFVTLNNNLGRRFGDSCTCMIMQACQICYMCRIKINKSLHLLDFVL